MNRFFIKENSLKVNDVVNIDDIDIIKHAFSVLRLKSGDSIELVSTDKLEYVAEITNINKKELTVKLVEQVDIERELPFKVSIFQGSPKAKKIDTIVQKTVECGVFEITPVDMRYSIKKMKKSDDKVIERLNKISLSAAEQSKRLYVPVVKPAIDFKTLLELIADFDIVLLLDEKEEVNSLKSAVTNIATDAKIAVIIGPEGGIFDEERNQLLEKGVKPITLGRRILRTETAGIYILAMLNFESQVMSLFSK